MKAPRARAIRYAVSNRDDLPARSHSVAELDVALASAATEFRRSSNARVRARARSRRSRCRIGPLFERSANARAEGALDLIAKHVMAHAEIIATPADYA